MPGPKSKMVDGWTVGDQVQELRGKLHLNDKDFRAFYEGSQKEKHVNEHSIIHLRQKNKTQWKGLANSINGDETVIKTAFQQLRDERLSMQRFTAAGAIDNMDQKVCEAAKTLNNMKHDRMQREQRIKDLQKTLDRMEDMSKPSNDESNSDQVIRRLENSLDKAQMKFDTAFNIGSRYEDILNMLKNESLQYPAKLEAMEQALIHQRDELKSLKTMNCEAFQARDSAKKELNIFERENYETSRARHQQLQATRKDVEKRKEMVEKVEKRSTRASLNHDHSDQKQLHMKQQQQKHQTEILSYEDAFDRIKQATAVTAINDVVARVGTQRETQDHLNTQRTEQEQMKNRLLDTKTKLQKEYHEMKFSGESKLSRGQQKLEDAENNLVRLETKTDKTVERLERTGGLLVQVKTGMTTLLEKLNEVRLLPPEKNYSSGEVIETTDICKKKVDRLMDTIAPTKTPSKIAPALATDDFHDFLTDRLPPENIRIQIHKSISERSEFEFDNEDENEETLTREDIKKNGQNLLDSKLKPKKRKGKK